MVPNRQNSHPVGHHVVEHRIRKPFQYTVTVSLFVCWPAQWGGHNVLVGIEDVSAESVGSQCIPFFVPKKGVCNVSLRRRSKNYGELTHRALRRSRASRQGTVWAAPERKSCLRCRISSNHALATDVSSSPSKLSSKAITTAERSLGSSARASSMRWSTRAFMSFSHAVSSRREVAVSIHGVSPLHAVFTFHTTTFTPASYPIRMPP